MQLKEILELLTVTPDALQHLDYSVFSSSSNNFAYDASF